MPKVIDLTIYIGVDPGVSGGLAALDADGVIVATSKMPETPHAMLRWLCDMDAKDTRCRPARAVLEHVWASPQMGRSSAFTFGRSFGRLETLLASLDMPYDLVTPHKWQAAMGVPKAAAKTKHGAKDKNLSKNRALQLFPSYPVTHAIADALLLAEYCRRIHVGGHVSPSANGVTDGKAQNTEKGKGARREGQGRPEATPQRQAAAAAADRRSPEGSRAR